MGLAQTALDAADPASFAPNFEQRLLTYGTGEEVRTRALVISTIGDMNVPINLKVPLALCPALERRLALGDPETLGSSQQRFAVSST